jgi:hypothetical protein
LRIAGSVSHVAAALADGIDGRELLVGRVAQENLDVVQRLERSRRDPRVPDVQLRSAGMVASGVREIRRKPGVGDPSSGLGGLHGSVRLMAVIALH